MHPASEEILLVAGVWPLPAGASSCVQMLAVVHSLSLAAGMQKYKFRKPCAILLLIFKTTLPNGHLSPGVEMRATRWDPQVAGSEKGTPYVQLKWLRLRSPGFLVGLFSDFWRLLIFHDPEKFWPELQ